MRQPAIAASTGMVVALLAVTGAGCLARQFPDKLRFNLAVERPGPALDSTAETVRLRRVRIAPMFDSKSFVYRMTDNRYVEDFYNEFFVTPDEVVERASYAWLAASGLFTAVLAPNDPGAPRWVLDTDVSELYGDLRDSVQPRAVLAVSFTLLEETGARGPVQFRKTYTASEPIAALSPEALVSGWDAAISRVLVELESDLRVALSTAGRGG